MDFGFHAGAFEADEKACNLAFADRNDESLEHYFKMGRGDGPTPKPGPELDDIYIERDDQCWGGWGGIDRVILGRDTLILHLLPRGERAIGSRVVRITFDLDDSQFEECRRTLGLIMQGYEDRLEFLIPRPSS